MLEAYYNLGLNSWHIKTKVKKSTQQCIRNLTYVFRLYKKKPSLGAK